jgi:hypothetical protein
MKLSVESLLVPALIASCLTSLAAAADAPTVDSILAKHIEAVGGKATLEKFHSRLVQFKVESDTTGNGEGEVFAQVPDRQRSHVGLGAAGVIDEGFDGTVAWTKSPWQGVRLKTGDELAKVKRDAQFHRELRYKSLFPDLAYKATEKVGDEEAWLLESKPTPSSKEKFWFSTKTALLIREESQYDGPNGAVTINSFPSDYKTFDGLKLPGALKIKISGANSQDFEFSLKFTAVKHNIDIDPAKFAKPAE